MRNLLQIPCRSLSRYKSAVGLAFNRVATPSVDFSKPPLLIFHGLFGSKTNWKSLANQLTTRTHREVFALDLRNHGDSPHTQPEETKLSDFANDIGFFLKEHRIPSACLLGHSLGGRVCSEFAFHNPLQVSKLILADISPLAKTPKIDFLDDSLFEKLRASLKDIESKNISMVEARKLVGGRLMDTIKNKFIVDFFLLSLTKDRDNEFVWKFSVNALEEMIKQKNITEVNNSDAQYEGDVLIVHGSSSPYVTVEEDYPKILVKMPKAKFVSIEGAGHYLHVEKPTQFTDAVVDFLK